ncbi:hypothetical protein D1610_01715 [Sphingomonas gilva]|uniref:Uncharacterized protein n=1 Tax=Sphingomonas gilva TaxID=2305907 RepID=A0A396RS49_9SPHN|nr:DUF1496 domain-containing protein [Sphingomonas gilva]RHW18886.1 hypothetical protein D1610_01715 [Sphingomonas gilva]
MQEDDHVDPQNPALKNSPKAASVEEKMAAPADNGVCYWNDKKYSDGATVCDAGRRHKCWSGKWVDIGNC